MRRRVARDYSSLDAFYTWYKQHQMGISSSLLLLLALTSTWFPPTRNNARKFFELSYYDTINDNYSRGCEDFRFVLFGIVLFTCLRAATMKYLLIPIACLGGVKRKETVRFAEQGWLVIHHSTFWIIGMYINYKSVYWMNLYEVWNHFPTRAMTGLTKGYYLFQFAFWMQQIIVINIEKRRKDYWQMLTHHIITCALLSTSYSYYQVKVGNVILCLVDWVDIVFATAKLLKYLGLQTACDVGFGIFFVSWLIARHGLYMIVCWSLYATAPVAIPYGCYDSVTGNRLPDSMTTPANGGHAIMREILQPFRNPDGPVCFNAHIRWAFLGLLGGLQIVMLVWLWMIFKVAYQVLRGKGADDTRSDDEGSG